MKDNFMASKTIMLWLVLQHVLQTIYLHTVPAMPGQWTILRYCMPEVMLHLILYFQCPGRCLAHKHLRNGTKVMCIRSCE